MPPAIPRNRQEPEVRDRLAGAIDLTVGAIDVTTIVLTHDPYLSHEQQDARHDQTRGRLMTNSSP
jgi:hypothetical protein